MITKKLFPKVSSPTHQVEKKNFPYLRLQSMLEELVETDVKALETYLRGLKERQVQKKLPDKINQRTKGKSLKERLKAKKEEKKLEDEIQLARQVLQAESLSKAGGGKP